MNSTWSGDAFTALDAARTDAVAANNAQALQLVRQARSQPKADWNVDFHRPLPFVQTANLNPQRELANIQGWVARRDHFKGNDAEALEHVLDILAQGEAIRQGTSFVVRQLTADGITALTTNLLEQITPDLRVAADGSRPSGAASVGQVRALIAVLLDDRGIRNGAKRAWEGEAALALRDADAFAKGAYRYAPVHPWIIAPVFRLDGTREALDSGSAIKAFDLPNWPAASAALPTPQPMGDLSALDDFERFLSGSQNFSARAARADFQMMTEQRAAAIALALRLYRFDHDGKWPQTLKELVPNYLPALPADPMAADGRSFGYHPHAVPPVIYSVGFDGIDDGGTSLPDESNGQYRWTRADAVFPLEPIPPTTLPASAETQDNQ